MPGALPNIIAGAVVVQDGAGNPTIPTDVYNVHVPTGAFTFTCDQTALPSTCDYVIQPEQINALVSELICATEAFDPDGTWTCSSVCNLATAINNYIAANTVINVESGEGVEVALDNKVNLDFNPLNVLLSGDVDTAGDQLAIYDADADEHKKISVDELEAAMLQYATYLEYSAKSPATDIVRVETLSPFLHTNPTTQYVGLGNDTGSELTTVTSIGETSGQGSTATDASYLGFGAGRGNSGIGTILAGTRAGFNNTASYSVGVGWQALHSNTGNSVTAVGTQALSGNTQGATTGIGFQALLNNTGLGSTSVGNLAGANNTGGRIATLGHYAGIANTGQHLSAVGYLAASENTGDALTAMGYQAGINQTGDGNTFIGHVSGISASGEDGTYVGKESGFVSRMPRGVGVGWQAGFMSTGNNNSAIGYQSFASAFGVNNTSLGEQSARGLLGDDNTFVGRRAGYGSSVTGLVLPITGFAGSQLTVPGHGYPIGTTVILIIDGIVAPVGLPNSLSLLSSYAFDVVDANTIAAPNDYIVFSTAGVSATVQRVQQLEIDNAGGFGHEALPTKDNQIVFGNTNVTEVFTEGVVRPGAYTPATLQPAANHTGAIAFITGGLGGGQDECMVYSDGINWRKIQNGAIQA